MNYLGMDEVASSDDQIERLSAELEDERSKNAELHHAMLAADRLRRKAEACWRDERERRQHADDSLKLVELRLRKAKAENLRLREEIDELREYIGGISGGEQ